MNSGKSLKLIQDHYNFQRVGKNTLVLKPSLDTRNYHSVSTRLGEISIPAFAFSPDTNLIDLIDNLIYTEGIDTLNTIFLDEAQFCTKKQIEELREIATNKNIEVYSYGLKTNFKGELFEGSNALLCLADKLIELSSLCKCGNKATFNMRINSEGFKLLSGIEIDCGSEDKYISVCHKCYSTTKVV